MKERSGIEKKKKSIAVLTNLPSVTMTKTIKKYINQWLNYTNGCRKGSAHVHFTETNDDIGKGWKKNLSKTNLVTTHEC